MKKPAKSKPIHPATRLLFFIIGMTGAVVLLVYSIRWEDLPFSFTLGGMNVTPWAMAGFLVLASIGFYTLIKSSLLGEWRLD